MDHRAEAQSENNEATTGGAEPGGADREGQTEETEFKITVRKLEMPVRPGGVLAE